MAKIAEVLSKGLVILIKAYQYLVAPLFGARCRFYPSCSSYCQQALSQFGLLKGLGLSIRRLLRCHPWHPGGVDEL